MISSRRYDLDWLRILAFFFLIYYHTAMFFIPGGIPVIQNNETSEALALVADISHQFRLALLFFISGVGVAFARRRRSTEEFIYERSKRLLIPLVMALLLVIPPMIYTEKLFLGEVSMSYFEFYPRFFTEGVYPRGNLSWHHMWFIVYLFLFCLISVSVFKWLDGPGKQLSDRLVSQAVGRGIYWLIPILFVPEIFLRPLFPGFPDLIHDWANFVHYLIIFWAGYLVANHEDLLNSACKLRFVSLGLALVSSGLVFYVFDGVYFNRDIADPYVIPWFAGYTALRMVMVWTWILTCLGFAARHLRFNNRYLGYVNEAVYPLFILHLTIITFLGYWAVDQPWDLWVKYGFITTATFAVVFAIYHFLIRPFNTVRLLFGVKPKDAVQTLSI